MRTDKEEKMEQEKDVLEMNKDDAIHSLQTVGEVEKYQQQYKTNIQMSKEEIGLLLDYLEICDSVIGEANGELMRGYVEARKDSIYWESTTLDDVIDLVCEWNFERLSELEAVMEHPESFVGVPDIEVRYEKLKEEYQVLNQLFDRTIYGKELDELAIQLAMDFLKDVECQVDDTKVEGKATVSTGNVEGAIKNIVQQIQEHSFEKVR